MLATALIPLLGDELSHFQDRTIGIAVLELVNPEYRNAVYVLSVIACISLATCLFLALKWRPSDITSAPVDSTLTYVIGGCAVANVVAYLIDGATLFLNASVLAFLLLTLQMLWSRHSRTQASETSESQFFLCFGLSWQLVSGLFLLADWQIGLPFWLAFVAFCAVAMLGFDRWYSSFSGKLPLVQTSIVTWIAFLPITYIAAGEISYFIYRNEGPSLDPAWIFAGLSLLSVTATPLFRTSTSSRVYWLGALILASGVIINEYRDTIQYAWYDLFHFGERVLPLQQWTSFSSLPFVDYLPVHGLFDALPHFIYQQLANSSALEALIWGNGYFMGWFMRAIAVLILYYSLSRLIPAKPAFFLIWLLPSYHYIDPYFCLLLLPAVHLLRLPNTSNINRWWAIQWMLTIALILWRLDFGAVLVIANIAVAIAYSWYANRLSFLLQGLTVGSGIALIFICVLMFMLDEHTLTDIALQIKSYLANQTLVTSYTRFYQHLDSATITQYLLFPASAALIAGLSLSRLLQRSTPVPQLGLELLLIFLCAISLMLSLRSLHRHSVMEGSVKTYLFLFIALVFLIRYLGAHQHGLRRKAPLLFITLIMGTYLFLPSGESKAMKAAFQRQPKWEYPIVASRPSLPVWQDHQIRLTDNVKRYDNFIRFMQQSLQGEQSFYDFSNAPLLYALADVELPVYITETIYQSSDTLQKYTLRQLEQRRKREQLPFVVFRQNSVWDALDGVDNALRSYLIAEYIYRHYRPCIRVDNLDVWIDRKMASAADCQSGLKGVFTLSDDMQKQLSYLSEDYLKQVIDFGGVPYLWARYDDTDETMSQTLIPKRRKITPMHWQLKLAPVQSACFQSGCYLDLTIDSKEDNKILVSFSGQRQFKLSLLEGQHSYRVRISALWNWHSLNTLNTMNVQSDKAFSIIRAELNLLDPESSARTEHGDRF